MKKNDVFFMRAENLGAEMEGVCRYNGMAVFVPGLLPGEEASVRIVKIEKNFAFGRMESPPASPSPERVTPDCSTYARCGGCTCRHMTYASSLEAKRRHVEDCLKRIGKTEFAVPRFSAWTDHSPTGIKQPCLSEDPLKNLLLASLHLAATI
ncbi:MAG: TRAM domain-containing protein [Lachnospiraceae bacterium]|nr:TRAM domain-containing protein [Lachnospiraceae bacterium]